MTNGEVSGGLSRRRFIQAGALAGLAAMPILGARAAVAGAASRGAAALTLDFGGQWRFGGPLTAGATQPGFDDSGFELVTLPHSVTKLSWEKWDPTSWERQWIYRRHFDTPKNADGLRVFLDFGAAMTKASLTLNGDALGDHYGGYLPFSYEVTDGLKASGNVLAVALDSTFDVDAPPDRPGQSDLSVDFWQPGGLYRAATLRAVPQAFLADVFARPVDVLDPSRRVAVECTVDTAQALSGATVQVDLLRNGSRVARATAPVNASQPGRQTVQLELDSLGNVALWDMEHPNLYDVVTTLSVAGTAVHDYATRIGFRDARFELDGFFLNGERVKLFGTNRHQFYPFAGGAMPARVQRRDAEILRRTLNHNMVRCSHYPQSEAFYDACDELGLMAWEEAAGWGAYIGDQAWQDRVVDDVANMVLRDRNHPSIIIWGARLNENNDDVPLWTKTRDKAHTLDPSRPTVGAMAGRHNTPNYVQDVFSQNDYSKTADGQPTLQSPRTDRPYMVSEAIGTLNGPAKYYRRTDPLAAQQGQAFAHGRVHDIAAADDRYCGLIAWSGFDYPSGQGNNFQGVKYTGVVDLFREPKPGAAIYRSQVDPSERPVIEPGFYWDFGPNSPANGPGQDAMICSNCERLELFVGGKSFATITPDTSRFGHLRYPPSFVDLTVDPSGNPELRIDGFVGGEKVISRTFSSDPAGDRLAVSADDDALVADGGDATRVAFRSVDRYGAPRPYPTGDVTIDVNGPATLVGETPFAFEETGGVGAAWIRSRPNEPGQVTVTVTHGRLGTGSATIAMRQPAPGGAPEASAQLTATPVPALVKPGASTTVTTRLENTGRIELDDVTMTLSSPMGWSAQATSPTRFAAVLGGQAVETTWTVTTPAGAGPGSVTVTANATFTAAGESSGERAEAALVVPTTLAKAFDNKGISDDSAVASADLDGVGNSYSQQALDAAGLPRGARVVHNGVTLTWPDLPPGQPDNVLADGQTLELSGVGSRLAFLGCTSRGPITRSGTVHYEDGTRDDYTLTLDDYFAAGGPENDTIAQMPYMNASTTKGDGGHPGKRTHTVYVFYVDVPLQEGKRVAGVTLPVVGDSVAGGPPAMHVFAFGVG